MFEEAYDQPSCSAKHNKVLYSSLRQVGQIASVFFQQTLDVSCPKSGGPWPAVVYVHGGSWMLDGKG